VECRLSKSPTRLLAARPFMLHIYAAMAQQERAMISRLKTIARAFRLGLPD